MQQQRSTKDHYHEAINRAIEYIEQNATKNINLEEIANHALISKYHFHRIFKSMIGDTIKGYLTRLRLEKSALLLKNTTHSISHIAYDCGYASPETFNRAFKNYFGVTPTYFRENSKTTQLQKQKLHEHST